MIMCGELKTQQFGEALAHTRNPKLLKKNIKNINLSDYKNNTFEEIYVDIYNKLTPIRGLGTLCIYDVVSEVCRYNNIAINKIVMAGNGPKNAIKLLGVKHKRYKINDKIKINYVDIIDVINAFNVLDYEGSIRTIRNSKDGDEWESFLCNWQKTQ